MQKSKIYGGLMASTLVIGGAMILLLPEQNPELIGVVAGGLVVAMIAPLLMINVAIGKLTGDIDVKVAELKAGR